MHGETVKYPALYGSRRFITAYTKAHTWPTIDNKTCQPLLKLLKKTEEGNCAQIVTR